MKTKFTYFLHLAGSTAEKPVTSLVAADSIVELAKYIEKENIDVLQIQKAPDSIVIL